MRLNPALEKRLALAAVLVLAAAAAAQDLHRPTPAEEDILRAAADDLHDPVAGLLEVEHLGHQLGLVTGDRDPGVDAEDQIFHGSLKSK